MEVVGSLLNNSLIYLYTMSITLGLYDSYLIFLSHDVFKIG